MHRFGGRVLGKRGAAGVFMCGLVGRAVGTAVKIDDGQMLPQYIVTMRVLRWLYSGARPLSTSELGASACKRAAAAGPEDTRELTSATGDEATALEATALETTALETTADIPLLAALAADKEECAFALQTLNEMSIFSCCPNVTCTGVRLGAACCAPMGLWI
jgi:hypothetical protein